jgi:DNA polymerase-1
MRKLITDIEEVHHLLPSWLNRDFAFDVETSGLSYTRDKLLGIALYFDRDCTLDLEGNLQCGEAYYISIAHTMERFDGSLYHADFISRKKLSQYLNILFKQDVLMIAHNAKFDMHFLDRVGVKVRGLLADTLLAAHLLDENRQNDLKSLAANVLDMPYAKYDQLTKYAGFGPKEILGVPLPDVADYAMNDVEATWKLYGVFSEQLAKKESKNLQGTHNLQDVYYDLWMPLLPVLQEMEATGIALDIDLVREIREEQAAIAEENRKKFLQAVTQTIVDHYGTDIPAVYLKPATIEHLENKVEGDDGRYYVEQDGVYLPIITHDMIGKTKAYKARILTINTRSSTQMHDIVYNLGGIELPDDVELTETELGVLKADKDNLETIAFYMKEDTPEFIRYLLDFRKADKFVGTYLFPFEENGDPDDHYALHSSLNQTGTKTGRISSSGPNLLNIPSRGSIGEKARKMFVARPGKKLIVADYAQAELRMLAHYSLDPALLQAFAENRDLHILTGAGFARISYEELYEKYHNGDEWASEMRRVGKTGNFALTYGMGAAKFQRYLIVHNGYEISLEQAREWIQGYNDTYKVATEWKNGKIDPRTRKVLKPGVKQFILKNGYVISHAGRFRHLPEVWSDDKKKVSYAIRQGINYIIQGSVGDIMAEAMIHIQPALKGLGGSLLLQIYDELVAEVPEDKAEIAKEIMETMLVQYCNSKLRCPQSAEAHIGDNWSDAKG